MRQIWSHLLNKKSKQEINKKLFNWFGSKSVVHKTCRFALVVFHSCEFQQFYTINAVTINENALIQDIRMDIYTEELIPSKIAWISVQIQGNKFCRWPNKFLLDATMKFSKFVQTTKKFISPDSNKDTVDPTERISQRPQTARVSTGLHICFAAKIVLP